MILPIRFLWEQLNGPQVTGIENAMFQYFKEMFDTKLDYLNSMSVDTANDSHLTFLGILANFIRPNVAVPDKDYFYFSNGPEHDSVNGVSSREDRTIGGKFVGMSKAGVASSPLNTEHYRVLLKAYIEGDGELGGLALLDDILYALSKQDQPEQNPIYKLEFVTEKDTPVGRAAGDVYIDVGTMDDWNNPMQIFAILNGLATSIYWPVPQLFVSIDTAVTVPAVVADLPSGTYTGAQTIILRCANPSATIYYTLDDSPPTTESTIYTSPITIPAGTTRTLKARAYAEGYNKSMMSEYNYRTVVPVDDIDVSVSLTPGTYPPPQYVELSAPYDDAVIYYTLDGLTPGSESTVYNGEPIELTETTTLKTMVYVPGSGYSNVKSFQYNIVAVPVVTSNVPEGTYDGIQTVELSCEMDGYTPIIYYTTDGSTPTKNSTRYTRPINIEYTQLVTAVGYVEGIGYSSKIASFEYNIKWEVTVNYIPGDYVLPQDKNKLPASTQKENDGIIYNYGFIVSCNYPGNARFTYTYDGTEPPDYAKAGSDYIQLGYTKGWQFNKSPIYFPMNINNVTLKVNMSIIGSSTAKWTTVKTVTFNYNIQDLIVKSNIESGQYEDTISIELKSGVENGPIYYTLDGSDPTQESTVYTSPIIISKPTILGQSVTANIKALTVYNSILSEIFEYNYTVVNALPKPVPNVADGTYLNVSSSTGIKGQVPEDGYNPNQIAQMYLRLVLPDLPEELKDKKVIYTFNVSYDGDDVRPKSSIERDRLEYDPILGTEDGNYIWGSDFHIIYSVIPVFITGMKATVYVNLYIDDEYICTYTYNYTSIR